DAADDDRLVRVAFLESDDDLLADARDVDRPPLLAGPVRADADPAGAVGVILPQAVPEELHLHPAVLVGEDLFARGPHDHGRLRAAHARLGRPPLRPVGQGERDAVEGVGVHRLWPGLLGVGALDGGRVHHVGDDVRAVGVEMLTEVELVPGGQLAAIAVRFDDRPGGRFLLDANAHGPRVILIDLLQVAGLVGPARIDAVEALGVAAGKIVVFQVRVGARFELVAYGADLQGLRDGLDRFQVVVGEFKAVVAQRLLGGADRLAFDPTTNAFVLSPAAVDFLILDRQRPAHRRM